MAKGKILKVKRGYNPNSSSIGTEIVIFFTSLAGLSFIYATISAVISSRKLKKAGTQDEEKK